MFSGSRRALPLLVGGALAIVVVAIVATLTLAPPRPPAVVIERLEEAVALDLLDQKVLDELRDTGESRATVHLDAQRILSAAGPIGATVPERVARMRELFAEHKKPIFDAVGPGLEIVRDYQYLAAFEAILRSERTLLLLFQVPGVRNVSAPETIAAPEPAVESSRGYRPGPGSPLFQGEGVSVGVLDTGLDVNRGPEFFPEGSIADAYDVGPDDLSADDSPYLHGTHVSSTVLLVAPRARLYAADVFEWRDDPDDGSPDRVHRGVNWIAGMDQMVGLAGTGVNLRAVNLSLGSGHFEPGECPVNNDNNHFYEAYTQADIIPVTSAGNHAFKDDQGKPITTYRPGINQPACSEYALSVGALTSGGCGPNDTSDVVWRESQASADLEVFARGACINAAGGVLSGTSMAAPQVAAAVAILASAKPTATNDEIKAAIVSSGETVIDRRSGVTVAKRRLDIPKALGNLLAGTIPISTPDVSRVDAVRMGPGSIAPSEPVAPGGTAVLPRFGVRNASGSVVGYRLEVTEPDLALSVQAPPSWFSLSPPLVTLQPGNQQFVTTTLRVPAGAPPGNYAALIVPVDFATGEMVGGQVGESAVRVTFTVPGNGAGSGLVGQVTGLLFGPLGLIVLAGGLVLLWLRVGKAIGRP